MNILRASRAWHKHFRTLLSASILPTPATLMIFRSPPRSAGSQELSGGRRLKHVVLTLLGVLLAGDALASSWLCVAQSDVGFSYRLWQSKWQPIIFSRIDAYPKMVIRSPNPEDKAFLEQQGAFLARPNLDYKNPPWIAQPVGDPFPTMACNDEAQFVHCDGVVQELRINKSTLRFQYIYTSGYINSHPGTSESGNTPGMVIGLCSAID